MDGYGPSTYGEGFADVYDDWYGDVSDVDATVERVAALAAVSGSRRVLELGGGSGRLALPLAARGLATWTVDASLAMVRRLRGKPGGDRVHAVVGDMAALPLSARARFGVVLCAFNTLFNLTTIEAQRRCLAAAADRIVPDGGRLVVESFVASSHDERDAAVGAVEPRHIGLDEVVLTVSRPRSCQPHHHGPARADHRGRYPLAPLDVALPVTRRARRTGGRGGAATRRTPRRVAGRTVHDGLAGPRLYVRADASRIAVR
jgi:SAM-dependent methyltransferase